jgi:hypothetical protein
MEDKISKTLLGVLITVWVIWFVLKVILILNE